MNGSDGVTHEQYPVMLDLSDRRCLVVGGGPVALRKTEDLLRCSALVHVVSPAWSRAWDAAPSGEDEPRLKRSTRPYQPSDLDGVFLAIAATDDPALQEAIARAARLRRVMLNVVDAPTLCDFLVPASMRRGSLVVSVSTQGKSPALAAAIRDRLSALLDPSLAEGLERLAEGRRIARSLYPADRELRQEALRRLVAPGAVDDLMEGRLEAFEEHWESWKASL